MAVGLVIVSIFSVLIAWIVHLWIYQIRKCRGCPSPGLPWPLIGHSHHLAVEPQDFDHHFIKNIIDKNDPHQRKLMLCAGPRVYLVVYHPEAASVVFTSTSRLLNKGPEYLHLEDWIGNGLLTSRDQKWRGRRKLLTPAFHFQILDSALSTFNEQADILIDVLHQDFVETDAVNDIFPYVQRAALDMILETAMGVSLGIQTKRHSDYADAIERTVHILFQRSTLPWYMYDLPFSFFAMKKTHDQDLKILHEFTQTVIVDRKKLLAEEEEAEEVVDKKTPFLDILLRIKLDDGKPMNDKDIQAEVDTFMFEGHDTTTCAITWSLFLIGNNMEVQEKLLQEQVEIFGASGQKSNVSNADLTRMKYLEACIKEALRLYPSVPILGREATERIEIDGHTLEKGELLLVHVGKLHRNPKVWDRPDEFIPERFLDKRDVHHPYAYVPFSAGVRNCIGQKFAMMEEKTILSKIIRNFEVHSADKVDQVKPVTAIITRPHGGIRTSLRPRNY